MSHFLAAEDPDTCAFLLLHLFIVVVVVTIIIAFSLFPFSLLLLIKNKTKKTNTFTSGFLFTSLLGKEEDPLLSFLLISKKFALPFGKSQQSAHQPKAT